MGSVIFACAHIFRGFRGSRPGAEPRSGVQGAKPLAGVGADCIGPDRTPAGGNPPAGVWNCPDRLPASSREAYRVAEWA